MECGESTLPHPQQHLNYFLNAHDAASAIHMKDPINDFRVILEHYTERALTDQNDVLRALDGLIRRFSGALHCGFISGLPEKALDNFILFRLRGASSYRRRGFPSYSWAGWKGAISFDTQQPRARGISWVFWYGVGPSGVRKLGHRKKENPFYTHSISGDTSQTTPTPNLLNPISTLEYEILQFWTVSVYLKVNQIEVFNAKGRLFDRNGICCGSIFFDGFEETTFFENESLVECTLISQTDMTSDLYYRILVLEWGSGVAERRGVGEIEMRAIDRSFHPGPIWKEILLG